MSHEIISHYKQLESRRHKHVLLQQDWITHGRDAFRFEVLEICDKANRDELLDKELYWHCQFLDTYNKPAKRKGVTT